MKAAYYYWHHVIWCRLVVFIVNYELIQGNITHINLALVFLALGMF